MDHWICKRSRDRWRSQSMQEFFRNKRKTIPFMWAPIHVLNSSEENSLQLLPSMSSSTGMDNSEENSLQLLPSMSSNTGTTSYDGPEIMTTIDVKALENSMQISLLNFAGETEKTERSDKIGRISHSVRIGNEDAYDPQIIAIGPLHRNKDSVKPAESLKWRLLKQLIGRSPEKNSLHKYIASMSGFIKEAREYYSEPVEPNDTIFVEMMVLDGCFLVEFLVKSYLGDDMSDLTTVNWNPPLLRRDLMLLENQLPFPILRKLFDKSDIPQLIGKNGYGYGATLMNLLVVPFVTRYERQTLQAWVWRKYNTVNHNTVNHLVHVYYVTLCPESRKSQSQPTFWKMSRRIKKLVSLPFLWLLSSLVYCRISLNCCPKNPAQRRRRHRAPRRIPPATQLLACGIKFQGVTYIVSLFGKFCKETGVMKIGKLAIHKGTISEFYNLIAFEQQGYRRVGNHFTSHVILMNNLINTPEDVAILKGNGIIESTLDSDQEVVQFFDKLCKGVYLDFESHFYVELFRDVTEYCNDTSNQWRAQLEYFRNPWATVSVFVAAVLLILTFLSTFYTMYAYHHPPSPN